MQLLSSADKLICYFWQQSQVQVQKISGNSTKKNNKALKIRLLTEQETVIFCYTSQQSSKIDCRMLFLLCWYAVTTFFHDFQTWGKVVWEGSIHKLGCKLLIVTLQRSWKSSQRGWVDIWGDPCESGKSSREAGREPGEEGALLQLCCLAHINIYSLPKTAWDFFHILEKIKTMRLINLKWTVLSSCQQEKK